MAKSRYQLTRPVWVGSDRLPIGHVVEFDGEPTGVYKGRCVPVAPEPAKAKATPPPPPAGKQ